MEFYIHWEGRGCLRTLHYLLPFLCRIHLLPRTSRAGMRANTNECKILSAMFYDAIFRHNILHWFCIIHDSSSFQVSIWMAPLRKVGCLVKQWCSWFKIFLSSIWKFSFLKEGLISVKYFCSLNGDQHLSKSFILGWLCFTMRL